MDDWALNQVTADVEKRLTGEEALAGAFRETTTMKDRRIKSQSMNQWTDELLEETLATLYPDTLLMLISVARAGGRCPIQKLVELYDQSPRNIFAQLAEVNRIHKKHSDKPRIVSWDRQGHVITLDPVARAHLAAERLSPSYSTICNPL